MGLAVRRLAIFLMVCAGLACWSTSVSQASPGLVGYGGMALESPLVVPEVQSLVGGQGVGAAEEARRDSPEAVAERETSRSAFADLDDAQAAKVDGEALPRLLDDPAGGPPRLPSGESISAYLSGNAAKVSMPGGDSGIVESMVPFARETTSGRFAPLDLAPNPTGEGWEPTSPLVGVRIAKHIAAGVELPAAGVSLTPVNKHGAPLAGGEGAADAAGVLFANTLTDGDTMVKASTFGFALETSECGSSLSLFVAGLGCALNELHGGATVLLSLLLGCSQGANSLLSLSLMALCSLAGAGGFGGCAIEEAAVLFEFAG